MPRIRTTPEAISTATRDQLRFFALEVAFSTGGDVVPAMTKLTYGVTNTDEEHNTLRQVREEITWTDIPAGVRTNLKAVYSAILTDAQNKGHIGEGSDVGDIS